MGVSDVNGAIQSALAWLQGIVGQAFDAVVAFVYGFLPDADPSVTAVINSWIYMMRGTDLDFNVYYFLDMRFVVVFMGIWLAVTVAGLLIMAVRFVLDIVHKVMDSIPIVG